MNMDEHGRDGLEGLIFVLFLDCSFADIGGRGSNSHSEALGARNVRYG